LMKAQQRKRRSTRKLRVHKQHKHRHIRITKTRNVAIQAHRAEVRARKHRRR
jgi:hypothetical protein